MASSMVPGEQPPEVDILKSRRFRKNRKFAVPPVVQKTVGTQIHQGYGVIWHKHVDGKGLAISNKAESLNGSYRFATSSKFFKEKQNGDRDLWLPKSLSFGGGKTDSVYYLAFDHMVEGDKRWVRVLSRSAMEEVILNGGPQL